MQTGILSLLLSLCMIFSSTGGAKIAKPANLFSAELTSFTTQGELKIDLKADIDEETKDNMKPFNLQSVLNALSDFKMVWGGNVILDEENYEVSTTAGIEAPDMCFTQRAYEKITADSFEVISEIPTITRFSLPEKYENARYLSVSLEDITDAKNASLNTAELYKITNKLFSSMLEKDTFLYKFAEENKEIFSHKSGVYKISFDNESFKEFIEALTFEFLQNKNSVEYIKALADYVSPVFCAIYPDTDEFNQIISFIQMADTLSASQLYDLKKDAETLFEDFGYVNLFGKDGFVIEVTATDKGYIKNINAIIDLSFDFSEMFSYADKEENQKFIIDATLTYNNDFSNFNKIEEIQKPEITPKNTVSYKEWLTEVFSEITEPTPDYEDIYYEDEYINDWYTQYYGETPMYSYDVELPLADGSISYFVHDTLVNFGENTPIIINGTSYVELTAIDTILSWGDEYIYSWDNDTKTIFADNGWGKTYSFKINTDTINFGNYSVKLTAPIIDVNGACYVPLKSYISAIHSFECHWDNELRSIFIY